MLIDFFLFLLQPERMLLRWQGRGLGFTSERKGQTLEKGFRSRMRHSTTPAIYVLSAQTGGNPQNGELRDTIVFSCEESFLYSERWFFNLLRTKHIYLVVTFVRTLTIRNVDCRLRE